MNFVTGLLKSKNCDVILIIIDRITKIRHYIMYKVNNEETFTE